MDPNSLNAIKGAAGAGGGGPDLIVGHEAWSTPHMTAYPWTSGTGFGTKYADPSSALNTGYDVCNDITFSPDGADLAIAHSGSPRITVYSCIIKVTTGGSTTINWNNVDVNGGSGTNKIKWNGGAVPGFTAGKPLYIILTTDDTGATWQGTSLIDFAVV